MHYCLDVVLYLYRTNQVKNHYLRSSIMNYYLCTNGKEVRFTIKAPDVSDALTRAITQFSIHGQYHTPIMASSVTDPNDYKSSEVLGLESHNSEFESQVIAALELLDYE